MSCVKIFWTNAFKKISSPIWSLFFKFFTYFARTPCTGFTFINIPSKPLFLFFLLFPHRRPSTRDLLDEKLDNWVTAGPSEYEAIQPAAGFAKEHAWVRQKPRAIARGCWKGLIDSNRWVNFSISYADSTTFPIPYLCKRFQIRGSPISVQLTSLGPNHCAANSIVYVQR